MPMSRDEVLFFFQHLESVDRDLPDRNILRIIDDKREPGNTLAARRLTMLSNGAPLFKLHNAIFFLGDLIKIAKKSSWFIDSNGKLFNYVKTIRAKLKLHKVANLIPIASGGCIIIVENIPNRFKSLYYPQDVNARQYVGLLHFGLSTIMYGFYPEKYNDSWRMV